MLAVSESQISDLKKQRIADFCGDLVVRARARHGDTCERWTDVELRTLIEEDVQAARARGIVTRGLLERYIDVSCSIGFGFGATEGWATAILQRNDTPTARLDAIEETAVFVVRAQA